MAFLQWTQTSTGQLTGSLVWVGLLYPFSDSSGVGQRDLPFSGVQSSGRITLTLTFNAFRVTENTTTAYNLVVSGMFSGDALVLDWPPGSLGTTILQPPGTLDALTCQPASTDDYNAAVAALHRYWQE